MPKGKSQTTALAPAFDGDCVQTNMMPVANDYMRPLPLSIPSSSTTIPLHEMSTQPRHPQGFMTCRMRVPYSFHFPPLTSHFALLPPSSTPLGGGGPSMSSQIEMH